jgi:ribose 5-phosphate isomerase B
MGARVVGPELAKMIVDAWLDSEFQGGGSVPKVEKMRQLEHDSFHRKNKEVPPCKR